MEESNGRYLETSAEDEASEPAPAQDNAQNEETGNTQKLSSSSTATASNARVSTFEVSGDDVKPPYTYIALVVMAISQSLHKMLAMDDICEFIFQRFPYYRKRKLGLRHSIQRTLRQDECFVKVPLEPGKRNVRDFVWKLHPASSEMFSSGDFFHRRYRFIYQLPQKFGTEAISNPYDATPPSPVHLDDYGSPSPPHLLSCSSPAEEYLPPHPPPLHPHNEPSSPQLPHPHNKPSSPLPLHPTESQTEHTVCCCVTLLLWPISRLHTMLSLPTLLRTDQHFFTDGLRVVVFVCVGAWQVVSHHSSSYVIKNTQARTLLLLSKLTIT